MPSFALAWLVTSDDKFARRGEHGSVLVTRSRTNSVRRAKADEVEEGKNEDEKKEELVLPDSELLINHSFVQRSPVKVKRAGEEQ